MTHQATWPAQARFATELFPHDALRDIEQVSHGEFLAQCSCENSRINMPDISAHLGPKIAPYA